MEDMNLNEKNPADNFFLIQIKSCNKILFPHCSSLPALVISNLNALEKLHNTKLNNFFLPGIVTSHGR